MTLVCTLMLASPRTLIGTVAATALLLLDSWIKACNNWNNCTLALSAVLGRPVCSLRISPSFSGAALSAAICRLPRAVRMSAVAPLAWTTVIAAWISLVRVVVVLSNWV